MFSLSYGESYAYPVMPFLVIMCSGIAFPTTGAVLLIVEHQCIKALCLAMSDYTDLFQDSFNISMDDMMTIGTKLSHLLDTLNDLFGISILVEVTLLIFTLTFNIFFGLSTEAAFSGTTYYPLLVYFGLTNIAWAVLNAIKLITLLYSGRLASKNMKNIKTELQKLSVKKSLVMREDLKAELELLKEQFSQSAAIRPCELFDLNLQTGVTILAWMATNIIVLMQFRSGEAAN